MRIAAASWPATQRGELRWRISALLVSASLVASIAPTTAAASRTTGDGALASRGPQAVQIGPRGVGLEKANPGALSANAPSWRISQGSRTSRVELTGRTSQVKVEASAPAAGPSFPGLGQIAQGPGAAGTPDTILARSPRRVLELVNRRARLFTSGGTTLATTNLNVFFGSVDAQGDPVGPLLFDPKVIYNRNSSNPRFYAVALQGNPSASPQMSRVYLAISRGKNPSDLADWCRYYVDTRRAVGATPDTWATSGPRRRRGCACSEHESIHVGTPGAPHLRRRHRTGLGEGHQPERRRLP